MLIIGLTGSIAMGKSSACQYLEGKGLPIWSADKAVHELYRGKAVALVEQEFPGVVLDGKVDRQHLMSCLMDDILALERLEAIVHPLVEEDRQEFLKRQLDEQCDRVVLDIPLLLEKGFEHKVDVILLMTAPEEIQRQRVMARPGMSEDKFAMIRAQQMDEEQKRAKADFIIDSSGSHERTHAELDSFLESLHDWPQKAARAI